MSSENWQPDPTWDYYKIWQSCHEIKAKIDEALNLMRQQEDRNDTSDHQINQRLSRASERLVNIILELEFDDDEFEDDEVYE
ncbi:hypothetical protein ACX27_01745 [Nostoc piscinale CENA21]|uniref:Uncharacterized protein n=1 Tax=Nostoc piscinale CENA21 TaxID=224013 RepID=A0A0M5MFW7_9NOSO|nr:hypothetical protein [Nostoc piscinale]ALF51855.1 hypothetical protein ACX27_01745 [Nostoc piscinale CENA21]